MEPDLSSPGLSLGNRAVRFGQRAQSIVVWVVGNVLWSAALGWVAFMAVQSGLTPVGLWAILLGCGLGAGGAAVARFAGISSMKLALGGALAWAVLALLVKNYAEFSTHGRRLEARTQELLERNPMAASLIPDRPRQSFAEFLAEQNRESKWWIADALAAVLLSAGVTWGGLNSLAKRERETAS